MQILSLQHQISKVFLDHWNISILTEGQDNFENKIQVSGFSDFFRFLLWNSLGQGFMWAVSMGGGQFALIEAWIRLMEKLF